MNKLCHVVDRGSFLCRDRDDAMDATVPEPTSVVLLPSGMRELKPSFSTSSYDAGAFEQACACRRQAADGCDGPLLRRFGARERIEPTIRQNFTGARASDDLALPGSEAIGSEPMGESGSALPRVAHVT